MDSAQVKFQEVDQSFFVNSLVQGIQAVLLRTLRGPYGVNDELITTPRQFQRIYGDQSAAYPGVILALRALAIGAKLRVVKIGHYTTISDPTSLTAVKAVFDESVTHYGVVAPLIDAFSLNLKNAGADGNNLQLKITAASNGDANYFNIEINHLLEAQYSEKYENLTIPGIPDVANSHYLDIIKAQSMWVDVVYADMSGQVAPLNPAVGTWLATGGSNGAVVDADYAGNAGGTGVYFLDQYSDFQGFAALDNETLTYYNSAIAYAKNREDCIALVHIPNTNITPTTVNNFRTSLTADTRFCAFFCGGLKIRDPFTTGINNPPPYPISEMGDVLGIMARSAAGFGPWFSFAGLQRGQVDDALAVINNFGPGGATRLDQLAQKQVNAMVSINGVIYIKGNFSGQKSTSRKSFLSIVQLIIYLKKSLQPTLERYLEQPNDFRNFRELYNEVDPFLSNLKGGDKRALIDYTWKGDQFANTDADLKLNNRADLDQGKYVVDLWLKEAVSLQTLTMRITSAAPGVSFQI